MTIPEADRGYLILWVLDGDTAVISYLGPDVFTGGRQTQLRPCGRRLPARQIESGGRGDGSVTGASSVSVIGMTLNNIALTTLGGTPTTLAQLSGGPTLIVNVASKCGLTPQYTALEKLAEDYGGRGLTVVGVPCNQFMGQEPGTAEEIEQFCSTTYGVTFPLLEKTDVNGDHRHPLYTELTKAADSAGEAGDIQWNFEKFLVSSDGTVVNRFRPKTEPDAPEVISAIEAALRQ